MGGNAGRVILPVALAAAGAFTAGLSPVVYIGANAEMSPALAFTGSPLGVAAAAGAAGVNELGTIRREQAQRAAENARNAQEAAQLRANYEAEDRRRRLQLKQRTAALRAHFAASGTGAVGGSAEAVIGGLKKVSESDRRQSRQLLDRRLDLLAPSATPDDRNLRFLKEATKPALNLLKAVS